MKNPSACITSIPQKNPWFRKSLVKSAMKSVTILAAMWLVMFFFAPAARAGQGAASFLDFDDSNPGFGTPTDTSETANTWSASAAGTVSAGQRTSGTQLTIGNADSDFSGPTPFNFAINLNGGGNLQGVRINSTNVNVTFTGTANTHNNSGPNFWIVTNFSSLTVNNSRQLFADTVKGVNWNNVAVTFQGPGTINFPTPFGCNSTAVNTQSMSGVINLQMPPVVSASTYSGGFVLVSGTLNFASAGSANVFNGFGAGKNFIINGGTIDNTSGSPMVLSVGLAGYTLGGDLTFLGGSSMDFGPAAVTLTGTRTVTVGASTLTLGPITGTGFGIIKAGAGTLAISGASTFTGPMIVTNGTTLALPNAGAVVGPLVLSGATLDMSSSVNGTIAPSSFSVTNSVLNLAVVSSTGTNIATPTINVGGSTTINITSIPLITAYPTTYHLIAGTTANGAMNFTLGTLPITSPPLTGSLSISGGSVDFVLTGGPPPVHVLTWNGLNGGLPDGTWDVGTTPTWLNSNNNPTTFAQSDSVTLNDTAAGTTSINMAGAVSPGILTVSNNSKLYTLGGPSGKITGNVALNKRGSGTLILDEGGGNDFSNGVAIASGTLQVGNNDSAGSLPQTGNIVNNGALVFNRTDFITVPNVISGSGTVAQNGSGFVMLSGANTFTGAVTVAQGTLQIGNSSALGTTNGGTTITSGATLDFVANANNIGQEIVSVSGSGVGGFGALVNNSGSATFVAPNIARVILTGDTSFGGSGRWDLRSATTGDPTLSSLSTAGVARKITKVGGNQVGLVGATVDPALGDIEVQSGTFSMEAATTSLGNPAANLIVEPGATFQMFAITNFLNKVFTLGSDGVANTISATSGSNNVVGPMTLTNTCLFNVNNNAVSLTLNNVLTGTGQIIKVGAGLLTLSGNSPAYGGGLLVNAGSAAISGTLSNAQGVTAAVGKLTLNGSLLGTAGLTNNPGAIIAGSGNTTCPADISGVLSPGDTNVFGTLTVGSLTLEVGGTLNYDLGVINTPGSNTNDLIVVNGDLTVNGNSVFINPIGLLQVGVPYRLFNYSGNLNWLGDLQVQNQGSANYTFVVNTNTPGQVNVVASGGPPQWNGGSALNSNWSDPANWNGTAISSGNVLGFSGNNRLNNINDTTADTSYGDIIFSPGAGAFTLNGNPIVPAGNIQNLSANSQTINLGLDFNANFTIDGGVGGMIVGGGLTNTATAPTRTIVTLAGLGTLTNLLASVDPGGTNSIFMQSGTANWTLVDNAASAQMTVPWNFDIRAGTFNFGTASSAPKISSTSINGLPQDNQVGILSGTAGTFNMVNGTLTTIARLNTATVANSTGIVSQVGGTLNIGQQFQGANGGAANEQSIVTISGGTMNIGGGTGQFYDASRGFGKLTVSGTGALNCGVLDVSRSILSGTIGVVNLDGGTITASRVGTATANQLATSTGSTATFNFNGGTLRASANAGNFFQGSTVAPIIPVTSIVKAGGAKIDDGGFAISILEPLQHDSALGATLDGGLTKLGAGTVTLTASNTFTGPTVVSNGTLAVNGSLGRSAVTVQSGGTLAGTGGVTNVLVNLGGAIAPGVPGAIGLLTVSNNATLVGSANMDVSKTPATNDVLKAASITLGGTLNVSNLAGTLASGDSFKLFNGTLSGSIAVGTLPPLWPGLSWNTGALNSSGIISVTGTRLPPQITAEGVSGANFVISGSGGLVGATYYVLATNNVAAPLATWPRIATNVFDASGNFSASIPTTASDKRFFTIQAP
jgi:fibronectin-binding autotransporter adhesin